MGSNTLIDKYKKTIFKKKFIMKLIKDKKSMEFVTNFKDISKKDKDLFIMEMINSNSIDDIINTLKNVAWLSNEQKNLLINSAISSNNADNVIFDIINILKNVTWLTDKNKELLVEVICNNIEKLCTDTVVALPIISLCDYFSWLKPTHKEKIVNKLLQYPKYLSENLIELTNYKFITDNNIYEVLESICSSKNIDYIKNVIRRINNIQYANKKCINIIMKGVLKLEDPKPIIDDLISINGITEEDFEPLLLQLKDNGIIRTKIGQNLNSVKEKNDACLDLSLLDDNVREVDKYIKSIIEKESKSDFEDKILKCNNTRDAYFLFKDSKDLTSEQKNILLKLFCKLSFYFPNGYFIFLRHIKNLSEDDKHILINWSASCIRPNNFTEYNYYYDFLCHYHTILERYSKNTEGLKKETIDLIINEFIFLIKEEILFEDYYDFDKWIEDVINIFNTKQKTILLQELAPIYENIFANPEGFSNPYYPYRMKKDRDFDSTLGFETLYDYLESEMREFLLEKFSDYPLLTLAYVAYSSDFEFLQKTYGTFSEFKKKYSYIDRCGKHFPIKETLFICSPRLKKRYENEPLPFLKMIRDKLINSIDEHNFKNHYQNYIDASTIIDDEVDTKSSISKKY